MNAATENNNELGISLLLGGVRGGGGVRGAVYLYRVERKGGGASLGVRLGGDCVYVIGSIYQVSVPLFSFLIERVYREAAL